MWHQRPNIRNNPPQTNTTRTCTPAPFALTPEREVTGIIPMHKPEGRKVYEIATKQLIKNMYNCEADGMFRFVEVVQTRARLQGW